MADQTEAKLMSFAESPVVRRARIARRSRALFKAMQSDFLLREQFATAPVQVVSEYVYEAKLSPLDASIANQLVFSLMSNRRLLSWLVSFAREDEHQMIPRESFMREFGRALTEYNNHQMVFSLMRSSIAKQGTSGFEHFESFLQALLPAVIGRAGEFGDEPVGGDTGGDTGGSTGGSTGGDAAAFTGGDVGDSTDPFGFPGYSQVALSALIQYATQLRDLGALDVIFESALLVF